MTEPQELTLFTPRNALTVLTDREEFDRFYEEIKRAVADFVPDVTTPKGRDAIKALAFKVTKTKTFLDGEGKRLTDDARKTISSVDASRRHMREQLETLKDQVRAPLDKWEEEEAERVKMVERSIAGMKNSAIIPASMTFDEALAEREKVEAFTVNADVFRGRAEEAESLRKVALDSLAAALDRLKREEEERAELARLRAEKEARELADAERLEAELREADRVRQERAEAERRERLAAEQIAREERAAQVASDTRARELQEKHEAELRQERLARERAEEAERQRLAEVKRLENEQIARDLDKIHRRKVMTAAKNAIVTCGVDEEHAKAVVLAIVAGEIPQVSLRF